MNINPDIIIALGTIIGTLVTIIWGAAIAKTDIYRHINNRADAIERKEDNSRYETQLELERYKNLIDREILTINGKVDKCQHKLNRLEQSIININKYLEEIRTFIAKHDN